MACSWHRCEPVEHLRTEPAWPEWVEKGAGGGGLLTKLPVWEGERSRESKHLREALADEARGDARPPGVGLLPTDAGEGLLRLRQARLAWNGPVSLRQPA